jgi:hypothetical protein
MNSWGIALLVFVGFLVGVRFGLWLAEAPMMEEE